MNQSTPIFRKEKKSRGKLKSKKSPKRAKKMRKKPGLLPASPLVARLFQRGGPGGPGRPKGSKKFSEFLEGALQLESRLVRMPNGKDRVVSGKELLALERVRLALRGPMSQRQRAMDAIENRIDGMPIQTERHVGEGGIKGRIELWDVTKADIEALPGVEGQEKQEKPK